VEDVRKKRARRGPKEVILHHKLLFRLPQILIKNNSVGWIFNNNSIQNLILMNITFGIRNG